jgi:hypothetical protein
VVTLPPFTEFKRRMGKYVSVSSMSDCAFSRQILPPMVTRRLIRASDSWAIFSELKVQSYFRYFPSLFSLSPPPRSPPSLARGDYEMSLEPEVGFTLSGDALWKCGFYHVLPPQKLRVSQGALPIGEKASDKSDAVRALRSAIQPARHRSAWVIGSQVVEKRKPSADMTGRVMALLHCEDGFVVTSENYCRIPVLGCVCTICLVAAGCFLRALFDSLCHRDVTCFSYVHVRSFKGGKLELTKPASSFMSKHPTFVFGGLNFSES